jgi:hypothetical protein
MSLDWPSGVFVGNGDPVDVAAFEVWRNRPVDSILFFPGRQNWNDLLWLPTDRRDFPGLKVIGIPPMPEAAGVSLADIANGVYDSWWEDYGTLLSSEGWNSNYTVIRLAWENNGNWYQWNQANPDVATFMAAYQHVVSAIRVNAPNVLFNWCVNKGPSQTGTGLVDSGYPGDAYVDIVGLDHYDHFPAQIDNASWNTAINQVPGLENLAQFVRDHNKMLAIDEWGVSHWAGNGGGDNPFFITKIWEWLQVNADIIAYETTYDDPGAPSTLMHDLSQGNNPNAAAAYLTRWGA